MLQRKMKTNGAPKGKWRQKWRLKHCKGKMKTKDAPKGKWTIKCTEQLLNVEGLMFYFSYRFVLSSWNFIVSIQLFFRFFFHLLSTFNCFSFVFIFVSRFLFNCFFSEFSKFWNVWTCCFSNFWKTSLHHFTCFLVLWHFWPQIRISRKNTSDSVLRT